MGFVEVFLIGVGLSMDAFAVAVCKGLCMKRLDVRQALAIALFFGGFQALMPLVRWVLGRQFEAYITAVDTGLRSCSWRSSAARCSGKRFMGRGGCRCPAEGFRLDLKELTMLAVATSIDALAVGITFAFLQVDIALLWRPSA